MTDVRASLFAVRKAAPRDALAISAIHGSSFPSPWPLSYWTRTISDPLHRIYVAAMPGCPPLGYLVARRIVDQAEIISMAVVAGSRRQGVARGLLDALTEDLCGELPCRLFLEVAADNAAAFELYRRAGFEEIAIRAGYYERTGAPPVDARLLARDLR